MSAPDTQPRAVRSPWIPTIIVLIAASGCDQAPTAAPPGPSVATAPVPQAPEIDLTELAARARYAFRTTTRGWVGRTRGYVSEVAPSGLITVREGDEGSGFHAVTVGVGREHAGNRGAASPVRLTETGQLELQRGAAVEEIRNTAGGVSHQWRFAARPEGAGDLVVEVDVAGVRAQGDADAGLRFVDAEAGAPFIYTWATWLDSAGSRLEVRGTYADGRITMRVPSSIVDGAAYPALLDPIIGPEVDPSDVVLAPVGGRPRIAVGGGNWFLVWSSGRGLRSDVFGARVDAAGVVLDPVGFPIAAVNGTDVSPDVAWDGSQFMVVWAARDDLMLRAARVSPAGAVLDTPAIDVLTVTSDRPEVPTISWSGTQHYVAWQQGASSSDRMRGTVMSAEGVAATPGGTVLGGTGPGKNPRLAWSGSEWLLAFDERGEVSAQRIDGSGAVLDPTPMRFETVTRAVYDIDVASNGTDFMVIWTADNTSGRDIHGATVSSSGVASSWFGVATASAFEQGSRLTFDGTDYVAAWSESTGVSTSNTRVSRVSSAGTVRDSPGIVVGTGVGPSISWNGSEHLLTYFDPLPDAQLGTRLSPTLTVLDTPAIEMTHVGNHTTEVAIAYGETQFLAVWVDDRDDPAGLYGARVAVNGTLIDSTPIPIAVGPERQQSPDVVWNGTDFFVVWMDTRTPGTSWDVHGARVSASGVVSDPGSIALATETSGQVYPRLAWNGASHLVVWAHQGTSREVAGLRVDNAGAAIGTAFYVTAGVTGQHGTPDVSSDGADFMVVWDDTAARRIRAARVSNAGVVLDPTSVVVSAGEGSDPRVDWSGTEYLVVYGAGGVQGRRLNAAAALLDPAPVTLTAGGAATTPALAWGGSNWLVAWQSLTLPLDPEFDDIFARTYDVTATPIDPADLVLSADPGPASNPAVASAGGGRWLVGYQRYDSDVPYSTHRARLRLIEEVPGCTLDSECGSGFCVDGVCCDSACGRGAIDCQACSSAAGGLSDGTCGPLRAGVASTVTCRPSAGVCDIAEACSDTSAACPVDAVAGVGDVCRPSAGRCDAEETCGGASGACPADGAMPDGTGCGDGVVCNGPEVCTAGACVPGSPPVCNDANACTLDSCSEPAGCITAAIPDCCLVDAECDDDDLCTADSCTEAGGICASVEVPGCCRSDVDCDDENACTTNTCDVATGECQATAVAGCCSADADCADASACTNDTCDVSSGVCSSAPVLDCCAADPDCDDGNVCTVGQCQLDTGECSSVPAPDCCAVDTDCDDGNICTIDQCQLETGACDVAPIENCCASDADCASTNACTIASCDLMDQRCVEMSDPACADTGPPAPPPVVAEGGCGCRASTPSEPKGPAYWVIVAMGLAWARRSRSRNARR